MKNPLKIGKFAVAIVPIARAVVLVVGNLKKAKQSRYMNIKKGVRKMNATNEIIKILSAMGAKPIAKTNGNTAVIKVNAPIINGIKMEINDKQYFIPAETIQDFEVIKGGK